jgi:hypothetical protein
MKTKQPILTLIGFLFSMTVLSQDSSIIAHNDRYKFGVKLISEQSGDYYGDDGGNALFCFGFQAIRRIKHTNSSIESGIYFITKTRQYTVRFTNNYPPPDIGYFILPVYHHYLSIPINYRLDTKTIYFSAGIFGDVPLYHNSRHFKEYVDSIENYGTDRNFYLGWNINLGMEKTISNKLDMFVEARMAVTVSPFKKEEGSFLFNSGGIPPANTNYGFAVGINYKLLRKPD